MMTEQWHSDVRRTGETLLVAVLLAVAACSIAGAQVIIGANDTSEIRGTITGVGGSTLLPGVVVACIDPAGKVVGSTQSDSEGHFRLFGLPAGVYQLKATLDGFRDLVETVTLSPRQVLERRLDLQLADVTETVQVVSGASGDLATLMASTLGQKEALSGTALEQLPLRDGSIQAALNFLPGVVQGRDGLSIRGGFPTQASVQVGAASAVEPASGETIIWLPADAATSVDVLPNPYATEYGRFSSGVTVIETRQGGSVWRTTFQDFDPTLRRRRSGMGFGGGIQAVSPRLFVGGPIVKDRVFLAQSVFYRYASPDILSRPPSERSTQHTASVFTRVDVNLGRQGSLSLTAGAFPQRRDALNFDTFNPPGVALNWRQQAYLGGATHSLVLSPSWLIESGVHVTRYRVGIDGRGSDQMVVAPDFNSGSYFNTQDRTSSAVQWQESVSGQHQGPLGLHLFGAGIDLLYSTYSGTSRSRPVIATRGDGTTAATVVFGGAATLNAAATDVGVYLQDRWQPVPQLLLEMGLRYDRDGALGRQHVAPRAGGLLMLTRGGAIKLRAGIGIFYERTPTTAAAFGQSETRTISRFDADGVTLTRTPVLYTPLMAGGVDTPRSRAWNVEYDHRITPHLSVSANVLDRQGTHGLVVAPVMSLVTPGRAELRLDSNGRSSYREAGLSVSYTPSRTLDLFAGYLRSSSKANLNAYAVMSGFFPDPFVRPDEYGPIASNAPHRLVARSSASIGANLRVFGAVEARSGQPYNALNDQQDIVGPRNQSHYFPGTARVDLAVERRFSIKGWHPWIGIRVWNAFNQFQPRDVQQHLTSPAFGSFYNHSPREFRFTVRLER